MIAPLIERQDTTLCQAIGPAERLVICLRFLATGDSSTVVGTVPPVRVWQESIYQYLLRGSPVNGLFHTAWVPLMGSTLQSKLLLILGQFSLVLLAVIDANHLFRVVDIGAFGKSSDGGTLSASALGRALDVQHQDIKNISTTVQFTVGISKKLSNHLNCTVSNAKA